jgi:hypothetical protein
MCPEPNDETVRQPPSGVTIPPGFEYITVGDMPKEFTHGVLMRAFSDYSVALGRQNNGSFAPFGSGVLVRKGNKFGILTAHHCLHSKYHDVRIGCQDGDTLMLVLNRGRTVIVRPEEVAEHALAKPRSEELGPDLAFIEILSIERLGTFQANGTFWSLDKPVSEVMSAYRKPLTPMCSIGFPSVHYNTRRDGNVIRHQVKHMLYDNAIKEGDIFEHEGWDYLDSTIWYPGDADLPPSFSGMSGGPVWGMELGRNKADRKIEIRKYALIGITFYEIFRNGDEGRLRAHFIKSIYELAWRNFD